MASAPTRELAHPDRTDVTVAAVLHALADPHRLSVVVALNAADPVEVACGQLDLPVSRSTYTHHFRVLRESGVIRQRYQGTSVLNRLRRTDLDAEFPGLLDAVIRAAVTRRDAASGAGS